MTIHSNSVSFKTLFPHNTHKHYINTIALCNAVNDDTDSDGDETASLKEQVRDESEKAEIGLETGLEYYVTSTDVSLRCKRLFLSPQNHPVTGVSQQSSISIVMKPLH